MIIVRIMGNGSIGDIPMPYEQYRGEMQSFVDRQTLVVAQLYILAIYNYTDSIQFCIYRLEDVAALNIAQEAL